jgi:Ca2+-binding EF-hand superfamily protein
LAEEEGKGKKGKDQGGGVKDSVTEAYENRIRAFSAPEKVFALFASKEQDGEAYMTAEDFLRSLHPRRSSGKPSKRQQAAAKRLFQLVDLNGDGLISFHEYIFFMTMLSLPPSRFKVAFDMFDTDSSGSLDQKEFASMIEVLKAKSTMGQSKRSDVVSGSNKVKGTKEREAEKAKGKYPVLFGVRGTKALTFPRFAAFLEQLQVMAAQPAALCLHLYASLTSTPQSS